MLPFVVPAAIGAAQLGLSAIPTAADIDRNKRLKELKALKESGDLGLTGEEKTLLEQRMMSPVKAAQGEELMRREAQMAASGQTAGGQLLRQEQAAQTRLEKAAQGAGEAINAADLQRAKEQELEIDQLIADRAAKQRSILDSAASSIGSVGGAAGQNAAYAEYTKKMSPAIEALAKSYGLDEDQTADLLEALSTPEGMALAGKLGIL